MHCLEERETDLAINLSRTSSRSLLGRWCHNTRRLNGLKKRQEGQRRISVLLDNTLCVKFNLSLLSPYLLFLGNRGTLNSSLDHLGGKKAVWHLQNILSVLCIRHILTLSRNPREDISLANLFRLCSFKKKMCD